MRGIPRRVRCRRRRLRARPIQVRNETSCHPQRMHVVVGQVIDDSRLPGMHVASPERLRVHTLTGGGLYQRRATEEDRALFAHDD
jgi:hypothetical protein